MASAQLNGITIHYRTAGSRKNSALMFCNSLGTDARIWDEVSDLIEDRYLIVSHDQRGHGLSDAPAGPYSIDLLVDDVLALTDHLAIERFTFCGVSVGGMIGQRLAARHPQRVAALVLCCTGDRIGTTETWNDRIASVEAGGLDSIADIILDRWLSPDFRAQAPERVAGYRDMLTRTPAQGYIATCGALRDADLGPDLTSITAPTLVIAGANDKSTPPELVQGMASRIAGSRFELLQECGHIPSIEQPERLARLISDFVMEVGHG